MCHFGWKETFRFFIIILGIFFLHSRGTAGKLVRISGKNLTVKSVSGTFTVGEKIIIQTTVDISGENIEVNIAKGRILNFKKGEADIEISEIGSGFNIYNGMKVKVITDIGVPNNRKKKNQKVRTKSMPGKKNIGIRQNLLLLVQKAQEYINESDYGNAKICYEKILKVMPSDPIAKSGIARVRVLEEDYLSQKKRERIRKSKLPNADYLLGMGDACLKNKQFSLANDYYMKLIKVSPDDIDILKRMVLVNLGMGHLEKAKTYWNRLLSEKGISELFLLHVAEEMKAKGFITFAISSYQHVLPYCTKKNVVLRKMDAMLGKRYTNKFGMEFIWIEAGIYHMGSMTGREDEQPVHLVKIKKGFFMQVTEVTQEQWARVMGQNPSVNKRPDFPVENVSWYDVESFLRKLKQLTGELYRLPTEAEWEYACRAGAVGDYFFGDDLTEFVNYGNFCDRKCGKIWKNVNFDDGYAMTSPVKSYKPNKFGLYDMLGNVWEWCDDWYSKDYYSNSPELNPIGPVRGRSKVLRGGGWGNQLIDCRCSRRGYSNPDKKYNFVGVRIVRERETSR